MSIVDEENNFYPSFFLCSTWVANANNFWTTGSSNYITKYLRDLKCLFKK